MQGIISAYFFTLKLENSRRLGTATTLIKFLFLRQEISFFSLHLVESFEEYKMNNSSRLFHCYILILKSPQFQQKTEEWQKKKQNRK